MRIKPGINSSPAIQTQSHHQASLHKHEKIIFETDLVKVGIFRARPGDPDFHDSGPIQNNIIVFPRTSVQITHAGKDPIITNPNLVMFYNQGQIYRRDKISERGDLCEWFGFSSAMLFDVLHPYDRKVENRKTRPFRFTHSPSDPSSYLLQRMVVEYMLNTDHPNPLFVEETIASILNRVVVRTYQTRGKYDCRRRFKSSRFHRSLTRDVQGILTTRFSEKLSLGDIAKQVNYSPYHISRVFRQQTGFPIHKYLDQLRLRTALEHISQGENDLTSLALDMGYSSHSHFTLAFRRTFGKPPSELRRSTTLNQLRELRKILIA